MGDSEVVLHRSPLSIGKQSPRFTSVKNDRYYKRLVLILVCSKHDVMTDLDHVQKFPLLLLRKSYLDLQSLEKITSKYSKLYPVYPDICFTVLVSIA